MKIDENNIFLVDGVGAVASAISLGVILPLLNQFIGMPTNTLYLLALFALLFAAYSFSRHALANKRNPQWLQILIVLNTSYCGFTAVLLGFHSKTLTSLGYAYFVGEIIIIIGIVLLERKVLVQLKEKIG